MLKPGINKTETGSGKITVFSRKKPELFLWRNVFPDRKVTLHAKSNSIPYLSYLRKK